MRFGGGESLMLMKHGDTTPPKMGTAAAEPVPALDILSRVAAGIAAEKDLDALLQELLGPVVNLAGAAGGAVRVLAEDGLHMRLVGAIGLPDEVMQRERWVDAKCGVCGEAARDGNMHETADLGLCARHAENDYFGMRCQRMLAVPLQYRGRTLGVYNLFMLSASELAPQISVLLRSIGELLGLALENARLASMNMRMSLMHERQMMASEVHDSLAQTLVYMKTRVSLLQDALTKQNEPAVSKYLGDLDQELDNAHLSLRELLTLFRQRMDPAGLVHALQAIADSFHDRTGISLEFSNEAGNLSLSPEQEVQVFHIVQEALANISRHARASHASVAVEKRNGRYKIIVEDDGAGIDVGIARQSAAADAKPGHYGLRIMHERAQLMGAELKIETPGGHGTRVSLSFPADAGASEARP
jgi:two-component system, NarL family, nitrate/nitrite sensor histidine kinase NarX